jgi:DNA-directed RNA polymerase subunit RPC12/RpoP
MYLKMQDYEKEGKVDWKAFRKAQIQFGEICMSCGTYLFAKEGPVECYSCKELNSDKSSITHSRKLRCPKCRHTWDVADDWEMDIWSEGEHDIYCPECEHEFEITTYVNYEFKSPAVEGE